MFRLPDDLLLHSFSYLPFKDQRNAIVTKGFFKIAQDKALLINAYQTRFGALAFEEDVLEQYKVAVLFERFLAEKESVQAKQKREDFRQVLNEHGDKNWAQYYFAVDSSGSQNCLFLRKGLMAGDYKAAMKVSVILHQCQKFSPEHYPMVQEIISLEAIQKIYPCLQTALVEKKETLVSHALAIVHMQGYGVPVDEEKAEAYFLKALGTKTRIDAALTLSDMYLKNDEDPHPADVSKALCFLEKTFAASPNLFIAHEIGVLYRDHMIMEFKAYEWFAKAYSLGNGDSAAEIASIHVDREEVEEARNWYRKAIELGVVMAPRDLATYLRSLHLSSYRVEIINLYKMGYRRGDKESAHELVSYYNFSALSLEQLWWLLTAVKEGSNAATMWLAVQEVRGFEFVKYAKALLHELGLPGWDKVEIEFSRSMVAQFREAGEREGLLDDKIVAVLDEWMEKAPVNRFEFKP